MKKKLKCKVIIIGGGYAGVSLLHKLKSEKTLELVLIDKEPTHLLQTHIHKYLSGYYKKDDITFNHKHYCDINNISFICNEIININYSKNNLTTKDNKSISYDYLVIATGSISMFPKQITNVQEFTKDIKNIKNLDYYKNQFLEIIDSKPLKKNIVVVGGGVSGLQIACEYAYTLQKKGLSQHNIQVSIVEGMDTLLPGMDPFLIKKAEQRCEELGIRVIKKNFASVILKDKVILSNNQEVLYDMLLFVIGASGNLIPNNNKIVSTPRNQLVVDEFYRLNPYNNVFAIGDIVEAKDIKTNTFQAPTAQAARMQAELTARNIINDVKDLDLISNNISNKGILIDLGGPNCAIGKLFSFNLSGKLALWAKKLIYFLHSQKFN